MTRSGFIRRLLSAAAIVLSLAGADGCGPFWVDPYITVKESPLNWVHIHYYNMNRKPIRRVSVYINGLGHVALKKGTSDQSENWHNIKTQRIQIDPKHANDIFQNLVNHGVLDREKTGKSSDKDSFDRFIAVKANLSNNTYSANENIFEVDPDLAEQLLDVVREFDNPVL